MQLNFNKKNIVAKTVKKNLSLSIFYRATICAVVFSFCISYLPISSNSLMGIASAATEINYQGKLMTSSNVAVPDGLYNMEFKLYTVSSGGTAIWTETRTGASKVQVTSGLFTVLLGSETSLAGIDFDQTIYLGVNIGGTGSPSWDGEMSPRKKFASVPSAFVSETSKALNATYATSTNLYASSTFTNALTINSYSGLLLGINGLVSSIATSSLGLLTTNVAEGSNLYFTDERADARVNAVLSATTSLPNITTLAGLTTAGNLATVGTLTSGSIGSGFGNINIGSNTFTGNGSGLTALNASNISTGVLAIARGGTGTTTAPTFGQLLMGNAGGGYDLVATSTLGISSGSGTVNSGLTGQVAFYAADGTAVSGTSTLFFANGNVGVGTTTPGRRLTVVGSDASNARVEIANTADNTSLQFEAGTGEILINAERMGGGTYPTLNFATGATRRLSILNNGNVGIGTTTPSAKLAITGTAGTEDILNIASSTQSSLFKISSTGATYFNNDAGTLGMVLLSNGTGSSPTWVATSSLGISGGGGGGTVNSGLTGQVAFYAADGTAVSGTSTLFFANGNVGVGTTTPGSKLTVVGTTTISGPLQVAMPTTGALIIGDITGNARGTGAVDLQIRTSAAQVASGLNSVAVGYKNTADGVQGSAFGTENNAAGNYSLSAGYYNTANGTKSVAVGNENNVGTNLFSMGIGNNNVVSNTYSSGIGYSNNVSGYYAMAVGMGLTNSISNSFMFGPSQSAAATLLSTGEFRAPFFTGTSTTASTFGGNVGIGVPSPSYKLDVAGHMNISGPYAYKIGGLTALTASTSNQSFAAGIYAGAAFTGSSYYNVAVGQGALTNTTGSAQRNTGVGVDTLGANTTGSANTSLGIASLRSNTTGTGNVAIGDSALYTSTSTAYSTAVGYYALLYATGANNVALGYSAGDNITSGSGNIILGNNIDAPIATGSNQLNIGNLIFGTAVDGVNSTLSSGNIGIGTTTPGHKLTVGGDLSVYGGITLPITSSAGLGVLTVGTSRFIHGYGGTQTNVFVGPSAGNLTNTGRDSIGIGSNALVGLTSARLAVGVGSGALERNSTGWANTAVGESALNFVTTNGNNTGVGRRALYATTGANNTAVGTQAAESASTGSNNVYIGYLSGDNLTTGSSNIILGANIDFPSTTASNQLNIGNLIYSQGITGTGTTLSTGNLGIGTSTPGERLTVVGTIQSTDLLGGSTNLTVDASGNIIRDPSDGALKENIITLEDSLAKITQLRGVRYEWRDKTRFGSSTEIGVIAQEVEMVVPEVVSSGGAYKSVNIKNLVALLIEGVKELKVQVDVVKEKVAAIGLWFGGDGNKFNVQGTVCVDEVCVTKEQFKQILINSGSASVYQSTDSSSSNSDTVGNGGTGTGTVDNTGSNASSSAPSTPNTEETPDTPSSDPVVPDPLPTAPPATPEPEPETATTPESAPSPEPMPSPTPSE